MAEQDTQQRQEHRSSARDAAREAVSYLEEMTGQEPEAVTGVRPEDGGWAVTVEVVELSRVPDTTDVIGCYEVVLDGEGEPVSYRRVQRYIRGYIDDRG